MAQTSISALRTVALEAGALPPRMDNAREPEAAAGQQTEHPSLEANYATRKRMNAKNGSPKLRTSMKMTNGADGSKTELVLKKLRLARGATIVQLGEATGWQAHSVRGFLSRVIRKKLGLNLVSEVGKDAQRRYRIADESVAAERRG